MYIQIVTRVAGKRSCGHDAGRPAPCAQSPNRTSWCRTSISCVVVETVGVARARGGTWLWLTAVWATVGSLRYCKDDELASHVPGRVLPRLEF